MTSLMNKVGLYDLLSMVLPGYLIIFMIGEIFPNLRFCGCNEVSYWIIAFCMSYVVGIIIHYISRWVFKFLHHNQYFSDKAFSKCKQDCDDRMQRSNEGNSDTSEEHYYRLYYKFWGDQSISFVLPLEAQLSFVRSLSIVGFLYSVLGCLFISSVWLISLIVIFTVICVIIAIQTRKRIYYYYYEAEHYTSSHDEKK